MGDRQEALKSKQYDMIETNEVELVHRLLEIKITRIFLMTMMQNASKIALI